MRLDKFVCAATGLSRKEARRVIRAGDVEVDGRVVKKAADTVSDEQVISWLSKPLELIGLRYLMFNKPADCVCATFDDLHTTVFSFIDEPKQQDLHTVGRLDADTTGLLLITDDGKWSHRITAPKSECAKTYRAQLAEAVTDEAAARLRRGILLRNEDVATKPADLEIITPTDVRLTIYEGRYHQVKRMFAATGNKVLALHREQVGGLSLDPQLEAGEYRALTKAEVALF
ncbi:16S rRNA pseudouridine(516) synthase RsuA [Aliidiomarina minuta]|uniref:Pseudouridine synthase n=1 Tax=Aliidiomarina minuta TaxID=880057 RepID=A0A432W148_9GAMM|nr:16S rRNA pseudouridine(516) synthase RsuA [Aliidiomarina minuta]RUO22950.1 16S rRNA pseudouridine(516) synthase RsuA [Aliidiomarina minuta]